MTNYEKIKSMSKEKMADFMDSLSNNPCYYCELENNCQFAWHGRGECLKGTMLWLDKEYQDE